MCAAAFAVVYGSDHPHRVGVRDMYVTVKTLKKEVAKHFNINHPFELKYDGQVLNTDDQLCGLELDRSHTIIVTPPPPRKNNYATRSHTRNSINPFSCNTPRTKRKEPPVHEIIYDEIIKQEERRKILQQYSDSDEDVYEEKKVKNYENDFEASDVSSDYDNENEKQYKTDKIVTQIKLSKVNDNTNKQQKQTLSGNRKCLPLSAVDGHKISLSHQRHNNVPLSNVYGNVETSSSAVNRRSVRNTTNGIEDDYSQPSFPLPLPSHCPSDADSRQLSNPVDNQYYILPTKNIIEITDDHSPNISDENRFPTSRRRRSLSANPSRSEAREISDYDNDNNDNNSRNTNANTDTLNNQDIVILNIRTLNSSYEIKISKTSTIQKLFQIMWKEMKKTKDQIYTESTHSLLVFNHRMHIFTNSIIDCTIDDLLKLQPSSRGEENANDQHQTNFYLYALTKEQVDTMYTYETNLRNIFCNMDNWWKSVSFLNERKQSDFLQNDISQSIFLSSLFCLRTYLFTNDNNGKEGIIQTTQAQFFKILRKYLFPPAVLALKHAFDGQLFNFEKALITDSFIKLLTLVCPKNVVDNELCSYIPLVFCWILEQKNLKDSKADYYTDVELVKYCDNGQTLLINNPVTCSPIDQNPLELLDIDDIRNKKSFIKHHVDIRTLMQYIKKPKYFTDKKQCQINGYRIYNPSEIINDTDNFIDRFTSEKLREMYRTMQVKYRILTFITKNSISLDVRNQLVLLQNKTVCLLFEYTKGKKNVANSSSNTVNHYFRFYNTNEPEERIINSKDIFDDNNENLPPIINNLIYDKENNPRLYHNRPIEQITMVLLDVSKSMFRKHNANDQHSQTTMDKSRIMLGNLTDNLVIGDYPHVIGLITFGNNIEIICDLTPDTAKFEHSINNAIKVEEEWTRLYDAIDKAIDLMVSFIQTKSSKKVILTQACKKLIICISDGVNNRGKTTIHDLQRRTTQNNIVVDLISFLPEKNLDNNSKKILKDTEKLCENTCGYVYKNLPSSTSVEIETTFEQQAAVWIDDRSTTKHGATMKPECKMPENLNIYAYKMPKRDTFQSGIITTNHFKKIYKEANNVYNSKLDNIDLYICQKNISFWKVIVTGPYATEYRGGYWMMYVEFSDDYPQVPPVVRFLTPIFHCNIRGDGKICHEMFNTDGWAPTMTMVQVFEEILSLLESPVPTTAIAIEKATLYNADKQHKQYEDEVKRWTLQYAAKSKEQLKKAFRMEDKE